MLARNKSNDGDDNVNNDVVQGRSKVESEEKYQTKINKIDALASDILDHGEESEKNDEKMVNKKTTITENYDNDLIHSDIDQDTSNEELEEKYQRIERTKYILELVHSEENERDELESEELILSKKTQKKEIMMI